MVLLLLVLPWLVVVVMWWQWMGKRGGSSLVGNEGWGDG